MAQVFKKNRLFISLFLFVCFMSSASAQKAPAFSLNGDNGKITLGKHKNKVVYLDFWASWCKPCRKSFGFMNDMQERYGKKGLEVIAINLDEDKAAAKNFLKKHPANFTIAYDPEGKTPGSYKLGVMPTSYLIDKRGNIVFKHKGFKKTHIASLEKKITQTLKQK